MTRAPLTRGPATYDNDKTIVVVRPHCVTPRTVTR
jgi:hypothetical protein